MEVAGYTKSFVIDQGTVLGLDPLFQALYSQPLTDPKRQGICTGLSMIWLARFMTFHDESPEERLQGLGSMAAFRWGGKTQDIHLAAGSGGGGDIADSFIAMYADALRVYVLRIIRRTCTFVPFTSADNVVKPIVKVVTPTGAYCLYNIGLRVSGGDAGHMVASYASHGTLGISRHFYLFDPNMGEYRIGVGDTSKFLKAFVEAYAKVFLGVNYFSCFQVER